jgi:hypothetical protein
VQRKDTCSLRLVYRWNAENDQDRRNGKEPVAAARASRGAGELRPSPMFRPAAFSIVSAAIVLISWPSLRHPRSHGFYRFFAFEGILALIVLNLEHWFTAPFSPLQLVSWLLMAGSLSLAVEGFWLLRRVGRLADSIF